MSSSSSDSDQTRSKKKHFKKDHSRVPARPAAESQGFGGTAEEGLNLTPVIGAIQAYSVGFGKLDPETVQLVTGGNFVVRRPISRAVTSDTLLTNLHLRVEVAGEEFFTESLARLTLFFEEQEIEIEQQTLLTILLAILFLLEPATITARIYTSPSGDEDCAFTGTEVATEVEFNLTNFPNLCFTSVNSDSEILVPESGHFALLLEFASLTFRRRLQCILLEILEDAEIDDDVIDDLLAALPRIVSESILPTVSAAVDLIRFPENEVLPAYKPKKVPHLVKPRNPEALKAALKAVAAKIVPHSAPAPRAAPSPAPRAAPAPAPSPAPAPAPAPSHAPKIAPNHVLKPKVAFRSRLTRPF